MSRRKTKIQMINNHPSGILSRNEYKSLVKSVIEAENIPVAELNVIAVDDEYLRKLHREYLHDDTYTDVMTFALDETGEKEAEIYVSIDRAQIQAKQYGVEVAEEVARLIVHGLLHLKGYDDHTEKERARMHELENEMLRKYWAV